MHADLSDNVSAIALATKGAQALILSELRASSLFSSETDSKIRPAPWSCPDQAISFVVYLNNRKPVSM